MNRSHFIAVLMAVCFLTMPLLMALMVSPLGGPAVFSAWCFILPGCMLVLFLLFVFGLYALVMLFFKNQRKSASSALLFSFLMCAAFIAGLMVSHAIRYEAFRHLAIASRPVTDAIAAFEHKHGHPPDKLERIVPEFLPKIPGTGMSAYPEYDYHCPSSEDKEEAWELSVQCPQGILNWDVFFYWPSKKYPHEIYGGYTERIGDWAYVHE